MALEVQYLQQTIVLDSQMMLVYLFQLLSLSVLIAECVHEITAMYLFHTHCKFSICDSQFPFRHSLPLLFATTVSFTT